VRYSHNNVKNQPSGNWSSPTGCIRLAGQEGKNLQKLHFDPRRLLPPIVLGAVSIGYIAIARGFTNPTSAEAPLLYGEAMAGLSVLVFILALLPPRSAEPHRPAGSARKFHGFDWRRVLLIHALAVGAGALVLLTGFYVGIPIFLFFFFWRIAKLSLIVSAAIALAFLGLTWLCFGYLLDLEMYQGYLYPMLFKN
jgi:hypothetical protein